MKRGTLYGELAAKAKGIVRQVVAERHKGFRRWAAEAREIELQRARRRFRQLIVEHEAKLQQAIDTGEDDPVNHLNTELRNFNEQLGIAEDELITRGVML